MANTITSDNFLAGTPSEQPANVVYAGPTANTAKPTFRALVDADMATTPGLTSVTDHFTAFSGWAWSTAGSYDDAPAYISTTIYPSNVLFWNNSITQDHFCYLSDTASGRVIRARLLKGMQSYIGLRIALADESVYIEIRVEDSAAANGLLRLVAYQNGQADAVLVDFITPGYVILELGVSMTGGFWYAAFTTNSPLLIIAGSGSWGMHLLQRWGMTFGQRGYTSDMQRACGADWFTIAS